jgi:Zn-dependent peptidase ImmA (M78 family)
MAGFKFKRGFKKESEEKAIFFRRELGLQPYDPLPAQRLSEYLNIKILTPAEILEKTSNSYKILMSSKEWSALTLPCISGKRIIIHNNKNSIYRQESDLMHEIAHVVCNHETYESTRIDGVDILLRTFNEQQEKEAEWLGGCLQIPREALLWHIHRNRSVKEIAEFFIASEKMVRFRINSTGVSRQSSRWH